MTLRARLADAKRRLRWHVDRRLGAVDRALAHAYLRDHTTRKLHIGCGGHLLPGWLDADRRPDDLRVLDLDATRPFVLLETGSFDFVFSEHMIEHVSYPDGISMLRECHRVLRRDGVVRISTPDLAFLVDLYRADPSPLQQRYLAWSSERYAGVPSGEPAFVINNFVRDWGHQFIHDERSLLGALEAAGFTQLTRCAIGESAHAALRGLENVERMPEGFLALETVTIEGTKR